MPGPLHGAVHVDGLLTDVSIGFVQEDKNFIAGRVAPIRPVDKSSDLYPIWTQDDFLRMQTHEVAREDPAPEATFTMSNAAYTVEEWPLKKRILDKDREDADVDLDKAAVQFLTQQVMMRRDFNLINVLFTAGNWTTNWTGQSSGGDFIDFSDSSSTPFQTVRSASRTLAPLSGGYRPNTLVVGPEVDDILKEHDDSLDKIKYTQTGIVDDQLLAKAFGVDQYLVANAVYNSAASGATATPVVMAGDFLWLGYVAPSPSQFNPSAMYDFSWKKYDQGGKGGALIKRWRSDDPEGDWIKGEAAFVIKVTAASSGLLMTQAATD